MSSLNPFGSFHPPNFLVTQVFQDKDEDDSMVEASWCGLPILEVQSESLSVQDGGMYLDNFLIYLNLMFQD